MAATRDDFDARREVLDWAAHLLLHRTALGGQVIARFCSTAESDPALEDYSDLLDAAGEADTLRSFDLNYRSKLWSPAAARETYESLFEAIDILVAAERDIHNVLDREGSAEELAADLATDFEFETILMQCNEAISEETGIQYGDACGTGGSC